MAPDTHLFLVKDDRSITDLCLSSSCEEETSDAGCGVLSGVILIASEPSDCSAGGKTSSFSITPEMDTPTLILDLFETDNVFTDWRNNPNIIAVRVNGWETSSKDCWVIRGVLHFIESTIRLQQSWDEAPNLRARL